MSFFSYTFPLCVAGALLLYYLLPKRMQWPLLLAVSLGFYLLGGLAAMACLLFIAATTFLTGLLLDRLNQQAKADRTANVKGKKKLILTVCLLLDFGLLFAAKYWNDTAEALSRSGSLSLPRISLLLPLGLSFYTFQSVGYAVDCYRGKVQPERNFFKYALFVSFFPQMVQGPIGRFDALAPQLMGQHRYDPENLRNGIQLALCGYLKKLLIADRTAVAANAIFGAPEKYGGVFTALGVLFYCIQLYCDFSGGIDVTRGVAQMFGIELAENFRRPIFAVSLADYWRRWHISLGAWMRDYVFYPLAFSKPLSALSRWTRKHFGGKLGKVIPTACATFVVYLFIGIWHGASFRYIVFGLYNGTIMTASVLLANRFSQWRKSLRLTDKQPLFRSFRLLRTMLLVFIGRYITRAPRLTVAWYMLRRTFTSLCLYQLRDGTIGRLGLTTVDFAIVGVCLAVLLFLEHRQEQGVRIRETLAKQSGLVQWLCLFLPLALLFYSLVFCGSAIDVNLIYQQY